MFHWLALAWLIAANPQSPLVSDRVQIEARQEAEGSHTLVHEVTVDAHARDVWAAISTPDGWRSWAAPVARGIEGDPEIIETSYSPSAAVGDETTIRQRVLAKVPERLLVFQTVKAPAGFPHFDTYKAVVSVIELEPAGASQTKVRLTTTGYADTAAGRRLMGFFRDGNRISLEQLWARFAHGPIDWAEKLKASR
jgi:uncharacterized protein YndB with AHSA1/START domain